MQGKDLLKKRLPFCIVYFVPLSVVMGYLLGGVYTFLTPVLVFAVVPLLDLVLGTNTYNPTAEEERLLQDDRAFRVITWMCVPIQVCLLIWGAYVVTHRSLTFLELVGFVSSVGFTTGAMGITVAHELVHRIDNRLEPTLGKVLLCTVFYMHWALEHVRGHHQTVATPDDPATARLGESFYAFWPRTVMAGFRSAWHLERVRRTKRGAAVWSISNSMILFMVLELSLAGLLGLAFGAGAILYFFAQSLIAFSLLEVVNYVEHYGLERQKIDNDRYERVTPLHSWNASNWLTNYFLFNLERHSDHHAKPQRRYQLLRHYNESPQLPTGYAGMILLAMIPPLWRYVMDTRVHQHRTLLGKAAAGTEG